MTPLEHVEAGIKALAEAREHFKAAGSPKTLDRVRLALTSAKGARRHAELADIRAERQLNDMMDQRTFVLTDLSDRS